MKKCVFILMFTGLMCVAPFLALSQGGVKLASAWIEGQAIETRGYTPAQQVFNGRAFIQVRGESTQTTKWRAAVYEQTGRRVLYVQEMRGLNVDFSFKLPPGKYLVVMYINPKKMRKFNQCQIIQVL